MFDLLYQPRMIDDDDDDECGAVGGIRIGRGNHSTREKTCPSVTLSTTNPTSPGLGSNPGRRGGKPVINRLSYGTAKALVGYFLFFFYWLFNDVVLTYAEVYIR
jgi:hypothetical protein